MLESTAQRIAALSPDLRAIAEKIAHAIQMSELQQDLISPDEARRIVEDHQKAGTEDWNRNVAAAVAALLAIHELGFTLQKRA